MGKMKDILQYYDRVEYCCCVANEFSTEWSNIMEQVVCLNTILEGKYCIGMDDERAFVDFYKKYKAWLAEKFVDRYYLFGERYKDCFSLKERKSWNTKAFRAVFGACTYQTLFFAQTFSVFASSELRNKDKEMLVAHKMYYGTLLMLKLIGYSFDDDISNERSIVDSLIGNEKSSS